MIDPDAPHATARRRRRGFGLVMMLLVIGMLAVFAVVATRLIHTTLRLYDEAGRADVEARAVDAAVEQLRRDVWAARQVTAGASSLTFVDGAGGTVAWQSDGGTLVRSRPDAGGGRGPGPETDADPSRWPGLGGRISFGWDGVALVVRGIDRGADRAGGVRMTPQLNVVPAGGAP